MCGIVGIMSKRKNGIFHSDMDIFEDLLFANQVRGAHGTGILYDYEGKARAFKGAIPASVFINDVKLPAVYRDIIAKSNFVIGHNRHATKGKLNFDNTHPFSEGHIALLHNGTLPQHKHLKDVEVDSHAICHSMADIGEEETLAKIEGAFALVWFNNKTKTLNFIRNTERPLWIIESEYLITISSEPKLAQWVLDRRNAFKVRDPEPCEVGQLYSYDPLKCVLTSKKAEIKAKAQVFYPAAGNWGKQKQWDTPSDYYSGSASRDHHYTPPALPDRTHEASPRYLDVRIGDIVTFAPLDVKPHSKAFVMTGVADQITSDRHHYVLKADDELFVKLYANEETNLNRFLDYEVCTGVVMQIQMGKGNGINSKTVVLKDVKPADLPLNITNLPIPQVC